MAAFQYRAVDADGRNLSGIVEADSARSARTQLRERGLFPLEVAASGSKKSGLGSTRKLRESELVLLTRQWAALLTSGLTVEQALSALGDQAEREATRQVLAGVRSEILAGYSLRAALDRHATSFPTIYRASVAAGEKSGELATVMNQLADYLERRDELRRKTLQALIYPAIVAAVALMVVIGLLTYVVPQVVGVFQSSKQTLPWLTRALIVVSDFLRNWGWLLALAIAGGIFGLRQSLREDAVRRKWDTWLLGLPLIGRHLRALDTTRFASTLAILVGSGVPLLAALDAGRQVVVRLPLRDAIGQASDRVREGMSLSRALGATRRFPPLLTHMIASGEATGQLDAMLDRAARLQQGELETRTAVLTSLLEPLLLLMMGGMVLIIVLAVMQPIIEINTLLK
ncbi:MULTISPECIES: type II secretion system inner membrane protein GspF [Niveibacterium]|uniref:Type II secretion system inner membrane protein GspF n=1 Tax=Niveibacterium microcysteis TaxID=2811415 RepID=A0ABX7M3P8_9RHOO|nr:MULTISPECIES: type II secretion system inner membrane protein GspF [Niveibacterium]QSI75798.1 type II secretion system inner membrane protein GspF [Niveibacterium microcysteis]